MTIAEIQLGLFEAFSITTFWSCFCRAAHTSKTNSKRDIRWAFTLLGIVSILCIAAPLYEWRPDAIAVLLAGAIASVQVVTSHHWRAGVPKQFQSDR